MKRELETMRSVKHPALIQVIDSRIEEQWFVMEYFRNGPLSERMDLFKGRVLDALRAFRPLVDALAALHAAGNVHRDVKPENIYVTAVAKMK
jgi:serine/threonine-protein kinase